MSPSPLGVRARLGRWLRPTQPDDHVPVVVRTTPRPTPQGWDGLLERWRDRTSAQTAFVVDHTGLTVALVGEAPRDEVEEAAVRLLMAFDQLKPLKVQGHAPQSLTVGLDPHWLTGVLVPLPDASVLLGLLGPFPVFRRKLLHELREDIARCGLAPEEAMRLTESGA